MEAFIFKNNLGTSILQTINSLIVDWPISKASIINIITKVQQPFLAIEQVTSNSIKLRLMIAVIKLAKLQAASNIKIIRSLS